MIREWFGPGLALALAATSGLAACADSGAGTPATGAPATGADAGGSGGAGNGPGRGQAGAAGGAPTSTTAGPPTEVAKLQTFLRDGTYKPENNDLWLCGEIGEIVLGISPHTNEDGTARARICATKSLVDDANFERGKGWPVGIAAVKEIYDDVKDPDKLTRYAYYTKTKDAWFWYEGDLSKAVKGEDGRPLEGLSVTVCQSCHQNGELEFVRKANEIDGSPSTGK
jgi:hypothetical protein